MDGDKSIKDHLCSFEKRAIKDFNFACKFFVVVFQKFEKYI